MNIDVPELIRPANFIALENADYKGKKQKIMESRSNGHLYIRNSGTDLSYK